MRTELIVGGDFEDPGYDGPFVIADSYGAWSGNNIEIGEHDDYHAGGSDTNSVLEMDGDAGEITVVEQSFDVAKAGGGATLSFEAGGRDRFADSDDPFLVEVVDEFGAVILSHSITPVSSGSFDTYSFEFNFPTPGTYTLRFTEEGADDALGTVVDNVSLVVCFARDTEISTPLGAVPVGDLKIGDRVVTADGAVKPVQWIGSRTLTRTDFAEHPEVRPIVFRQNSLGKGMPSADLMVSPQHRILVRSKVAERIFGTREALVPAKKLLGLPGVEVLEDCEEVTYVHFALEEHDVVLAQGAYAETLYLGQQALATLEGPAAEELTVIFPELASAQFVPKPARHLKNRNKEIEKLCARLSRNNKPVVECAL